MDDSEILVGVIEQVSNALELIKILDAPHKEEALELIQELVREASL